ncbi:hypothetical protein MMC30_009299 [Trapelia coarctata]|nr:hypothetical protein [Trapelia coarctata]
MASKYNTASLPWRVTSDLIAAFCASTLIAPIVTIIDKSIILRTSTRAPLSTILTTSLTSALRHPGTFLLSAPYLLITTLYFGTYTTANLVDTISSTVYKKPADTVTAGPAKFLATTGVNMSLCLYKDARYARMFGAGGGGTAPSPPPTPNQTPKGIVSTSTTKALAEGGKALAKAGSRSVPKRTLALFAARDSLTVFASFNIPPLLGPVIGSQNVAQFLAPASVQILSTPLHLLGLDLYNRRDGVGEKIGWRDRWGRIRRDWGGAALARMGRVVPAYGVGGVVNGGVRGWLLRDV